MATVKEHYDTHLGKLYAWLMGNFDERVQQQLHYFQQQQIAPSQNGIALDLGCGHGIQSIALSQLGFTVVAVDFNHELLKELEANAQGKPVTAVESSLAEVSKYSRDCELIVCMGDTLTHLDSIEEVQELFVKWLKLLLPGGKLVLAFRDMGREVEGEKRFFPVKSDADRILTCFVEYHPSHVLVHDLLHERDNEQWNFSISSYKKLRLHRNQVAGMLVKSGFRVVDGREVNGMLHVIAIPLASPL